VYAAGNGAVDVSSIPAGARVRSGYLIPLKVTSLVLMLAYLWQPVSAGLLVTGRVGFVTWHDIGAGVALLAAVVQVVAAILLRWPGGGNWRPIIGASVQAVLIVVQMALGGSREFAIHFPLGVALFGGGLMYFVMVWFSADIGRRYRGVPAVPATQPEVAR
jgi:hypothetical protein